MTFKIATSYFYQVRFFKNYMIPVSTAKFDPKWYHDFKEQSHLYKDQSGNIIGIRYPDFAPCDELGGCCSSCTEKVGGSCNFLNGYRAQLDRLNFENVLIDLHRIAKSHKNSINYEITPIIVLLVHEAPDNPCSERVILQEYFNDNGYSVEELKYPIKDNYV